VLADQAAEHRAECEGQRADGGPDADRHHGPQAHGALRRHPSKQDRPSYP
jgi:hypothetical protein